MGVTDIRSGRVVATVPIVVDVDKVVYDNETYLIFCSNADATTTIIRQESP